MHEDLGGLVVHVSSCKTKKGNPEHPLGFGFLGIKCYVSDTVL